MEYPGSRLNKTIRLSILLTFIGLFLLLTPIILFYTVGYRYDWKNGLLKETGAISIEVSPATTTIYINNQKINDQSPVRLSTVSPNRYTVRLALPGYYDWTKEISVRNQQTVYLKDIHLLRQSEPVAMASGTLGTLSLSPDGESLLYTSTVGGMNRVILKNLTRNTDTIVTSVPATSPLTLAWSKRNNYFALIQGNAPRFSIRLASANRPEDLWTVTRTSTPATAWQWRDSLAPEFYYSTTSSLYSVLPSNRYQSVAMANRPANWQYAGGELWTMSFATSSREWVIRKDVLGFNRVFASLSEEYISGISPGSPSVQLAAVYDSTALIKAGQQLFIIVTPEKKFMVRASNFYLSPHNNWLVLYSPFEVWTYLIGEEPTVLSRSGEHLNYVAAIDEFNTLALATNRGITALFPFYLVSNTLLNTATGELFVDERGRLLYGIDRSSPVQTLWRLRY